MPVYCGFEQERPSKRPPSILRIGLDEPGPMNLALPASRMLNIWDEPARLAYPSLLSKTIISFAPHPRGLLDIALLSCCTEVCPQTRRSMRILRDPCTVLHELRCIYVIGKNQHKFASHTKHNIGIAGDRGWLTYMISMAKCENAGEEESEGMLGWTTNPSRLYRVQKMKNKGYGVG